MEKQEFCFLKGLVDCSPGTIQDCNVKRVRSCWLQEEEERRIGSRINNKANPEGLPEPAFCYLKGLVDCQPRIIQDCNMKQVRSCWRQEEEERRIGSRINNKANPEGLPDTSFCFLKGLIDCQPGTIQDCNMKHVTKCKLEEDTGV